MQQRPEPIRFCFSQRCGRLPAAAAGPSLLYNEGLPTLGSRRAGIFARRRDLRRARPRAFARAFTCPCAEAGGWNSGQQSPKIILLSCEAHRRTGKTRIERFRTGPWELSINQAQSLPDMSLPTPTALSGPISRHSRTASSTCSASAPSLKSRVLPNRGW